MSPEASVMDAVIRQSITEDRPISSQDENSGATNNYHMKNRKKMFEANDDSQYRKNRSRSTHENTTKHRKDTNLIENKTRY